MAAIWIILAIAVVVILIIALPAAWLVKHIWFNKNTPRRTFKMPPADEAVMNISDDRVNGLYKDLNKQKFGEWKNEFKDMMKHDATEGAETAMNYKMYLETRPLEILTAPEKYGLPTKFHWCAGGGKDKTERPSTPADVVMVRGNVVVGDIPLRSEMISGIGTQEEWDLYNGIYQRTAKQKVLLMMGPYRHPSYLLKYMSNVQEIATWIIKPKSSKRQAGGADENSESSSQNPKTGEKKLSKSDSNPNARVMVVPSEGDEVVYVQQLTCQIINPDITVHYMRIDYEVFRVSKIKSNYFKFVCYNQWPLYKYPRDFDSILSFMALAEKLREKFKAPPVFITECSNAHDHCLLVTHLIYCYMKYKCPDQITFKGAWQLATHLRGSDVSNEKMMMWSLAFAIHYLNKCGLDSEGKTMATDWLRVYDAYAEALRKKGDKTEEGTLNLSNRVKTRQKMT